MTYVSQVLIVDDNDSICQSLKLIFERKGYKTAIASTGKGALMKVHSTEFHIALVDIQLPDMTGLELLVKLIEQNSQISVVIITGHSSKETAIKAIENGAEAYIEKPLDIEELLQILSQISERKRRESEKLQKDHEFALKVKESELYIARVKKDIKEEMQTITRHFESALKLVEGTNIEFKELLESGLAGTERIDKLLNALDHTEEA